MNDLSEDDWVIIPAGKTVTAEHDGKFWTSGCISYFD